jgi:hypothetical protein
VRDRFIEKSLKTYGESKLQPATPQAPQPPETSTRAIKLIEVLFDQGVLRDISISLNALNQEQLDTPIDARLSATFNNHLSMVFGFTPTPPYDDSTTTSTVLKDLYTAIDLEKRLQNSIQEQELKLFLMNLREEANAKLPT